MAAPTRPDNPNPNRSAAARMGHERRARRRRLARMLGAALRRLEPTVTARHAQELQDEPERFAEWIVTQAADAATEWDEPDLVGGEPTPVVTVEELEQAAAELVAFPLPTHPAEQLLGLQADGEVDADEEPERER